MQKLSLNVPNEEKNLRRRNKIDSLLKSVRKVSVQFDSQSWKAKLLALNTVKLSDSTLLLYT